jgi:ethanolamine utilization protein EutQ (cupin superfamily)
LARSHLNGKNLGVVVCTCHPTYGGRIVAQAGLGKKQDSTSQITRAQMGECLHSKCKDLSSNSSTTKKKERKKIVIKLFKTASMNKPSKLSTGKKEEVYTGCQKHDKDKKRQGG